VSALNLPVRDTRLRLDHLVSLGILNRDRGWYTFEDSNARSASALGFETGQIREIKVVLQESFGPLSAEAIAKLIRTFGGKGWRKLTEFRITDPNLRVVQLYGR
jgi:hypothetical protein